MSHSSPKSDVYQTVTNSIIAMIEAGAGSWHMPWHNDPSVADAALTLPSNPVSGTRYRGVNVPLLWCAAQDNNYQTHQWATYKQWAEKKAQVRKGEKATTIVFWKRLDVAAPSGDGGDKPKSIMMARAYSVFNLAQVDGYEAKVVPIAPIVDRPQARVEQADAYFSSIAIAHGSELVRHGGNRAFYAPSRDVICVPHFAQFDAPVDYYSTLAHEHVHYTGHEKRCAREFGRRFGDSAYAFEELVAELGAAFLCAELGLSN